MMSLTKPYSPALSDATDSISDLVDHFKLEAQHFPDYIQHTEYVSDSIRGIRKIRVEKKWYRQRMIGRGGFGAVWLEEHRNDDGSTAQRAVKEIDKLYMEAVTLDYKRELLALAKLSKHKEAFVEFYGWFETHETVFLSMEYIQHGDLENHIRPTLTENDTRQITSQLLDGLHIMHQNGFTHRDLKPANIFVLSTSPSWWVKIGDFGISKRAQNTSTALRTQIGTPCFQAPEVRGLVVEFEHSSEYTSAVDMWSLGCVVYQLLCQKLPFPDPNTLLLFTRTRIPFPTKDLRSRLVSDQGVDFLRGLLVPNPSKRFTAVAAMKAPWFRSISKFSAPAYGRSSIVSAESKATYKTALSKIGLSESETQRVPIARKMVGSAPSEVLSSESKPNSELSEINWATSGVHYTEPVKSQTANLSQEMVDSTPSDTILFDKETSATLSAYSARSTTPDRRGNPANAPSRHISFRNMTPAAEASTFKVQSLEKSKLPARPYRKADVRKSPEKDNKEGGTWTPLHIAAERGREEEVRNLVLAKSSDINARAGRNGQTPLFQAAMQGHADIISLLLKHGADSEIPGITDLYTPLLIAAERGYELAVKILLGNGANHQAKTRIGKTALHVTALKGHKSILELFLAQRPKLDVNAISTSQDGVTATPLYQAATTGHEEVASMLLDHGAIPEIASSKDGYTPLLIAAEGGYEKAVEVLLGRGANVKATSTKAWTALHVSAQNGHTSVVRILLTRNPDISARASTYGQTPLYQAAMKGHDDVARLLLDAGADPRMKNIGDRYTPVTIAAQRGHKSTVDLLLRRGGKKPRHLGYRIKMFGERYFAKNAD